MKVALITDTHFGVRNDSQQFHNNNEKFFHNLFFPFLRENNITKLLHLGDIVDRRKYINFSTAKRLREDFLDPLLINDIETHIILGNHDVYYKNTNEINAIEEIIDGRYSNFNIYYQPTEIEIDNTKILMLPWICEQNKDLTNKMVRDTKAQICMGHLELSGFHLFKGSMLSDGDSPETYSKFDMVMSGHYHHRSHSKNVYYLGSHAEFTWVDFDDPKGFHVFDTTTRELEFIKNPYTMYNKIYYDGNTSVSEEDCKDKILRIVVKNKTDTYDFDKFISEVESYSPVDYQVVEDVFEYQDILDEVDDTESTIDIFKKYIQKSETKDINKQKLEKAIVDLYHEALEIE